MVLPASPVAHGPGGVVNDGYMISVKGVAHAQHVSQNPGSHQAACPSYLTLPSQVEDDSAYVQRRDDT
jgi:hypothetical protein